jgi:hypothetical protein
MLDLEILGKDFFFGKNCVETRKFKLSGDKLVNEHSIVEGERSVGYRDNGLASPFCFCGVYVSASNAPHGSVMFGLETSSSRWTMRHSSEISPVRGVWVLGDPGAWMLHHGKCRRWARYCRNQFRWLGCWLQLVFAFEILLYPGSGCQTR